MSEPSTNWKQIALKKYMEKLGEDYIQKLKTEMEVEHELCDLTEKEMWDISYEGSHVGYTRTPLLWIIENNCERDAYLPHDHPDYDDEFDYDASWDFPWDFTWDRRDDPHWYDHSGDKEIEHYKKKLREAWSDLNKALIFIGTKNMTDEFKEFENKMFDGTCIC